MHLDDLPAAGARVQRVDVLGDHRLHEPTALELRECAVRSVRLGGAEQVDALAVEAPDPSGVPTESLDGGDLEGSTSAQIPVGGRESPGIPDSVLDSRAGQHDTRLALADQGGKRGDRHGRIVVLRRGGLLILDGRANPVRGDRRAGHRAPRLVRRVARGGPRRVSREHAGGYQAIRDGGIEALTTEVNLRYHRAAYFDETLRVWARCGDLRGARFAYEYRVERAGELVADGYTRHATVDRDTYRPTRVADWLVERSLWPRRRRGSARTGGRLALGRSFCPWRAPGLVTTFVPTLTTRFSPSYEVVQSPSG